MRNNKNSSYDSTFRKFINFLYRVKIIGRHIKYQSKLSFNWLFKSKETTNFTYDLSDLNIKYLASFIADITNRDFSEIMGYLNEIINDVDLKNHIWETTNELKISDADVNAKFGRRIGWYAIARAIKPRIIVETGVDKGLGSCVLTAALIRNSKEGSNGKYYGTDINPSAGFLFTGKYNKFGKILYGDSIESLKKFDKKIDLFVNDSDHSPEYEEAEYEAIRNKITKKAIIIGDNSHVTDKLIKFAMKNGRQFLFFQERPKNHWYRGDGIGVAYKK